MLYLVSGSSRSGKTTIAQRILKQEGIPYLSLDWIMMGFTNGMPEFGIHDKLWPDEIAKRLESFLVAMCESVLWTGQNLVIEGEAILPQSARGLIVSHPEQVRACFLGFANVDIDQKVREAKTYSSGERDWLTEESDATIRNHIKNMVEHSRLIEAQCKANGIQYFDTSTGFLATIDEATAYLLSPSG
ncbi:MAG: hypothetical protein HKN29_09360 [Rhodothermales bacterium]|nr:hypothetical protein [Rhodothermales bacterium]